MHKKQQRVTTASWLVLGGALLAGAAYAQAPASTGSNTSTSAPNLVRICDDRGCADRPTDSATFDTPEHAPSAPPPRLQRLISLAQSQPKAAYDLGLRYFRGDGVERDSYEALKWMRSAGDRGVRDAQLALGKLYLTGLEEMGADPGEAQSWLSKAAAGGSAEAQRLLPQATAAKNGVQADYAAREKQRKTWYILWYRSAPYYWYWNQGVWVCQHCH
jgi:TPR repeat protein